ncbi:site-specific integrase, partial [Desulfovibrio porci]
PLDRVQSIWHSYGCSPCPRLGLLLSVNSSFTGLRQGEQPIGTLHLGTAFLKLALLTGIRRGALLALRWTDIDFERGIILLRAESAKNKRSSYIPLNHTAREVLAYIPRTGEYVFPGKTGKPRENFRRTAYRVRERAGLPRDFRPVHSLRHVFASLLVNKGVDLYTVKELLTHSNISMTERYSHLKNTVLKKATENVDTILDEIQNINTDSKND